VGVVENVKQIAEVLRKIDNVELYRQILDLQAEILQLVEENRQLKARVREVEEQLTINAVLVFEKDCYWRPQEKGSPDGPYCSNCWDNRRQLVRMIKCGDPDYVQCPTCKHPIALVRRRDPEWR